MAGRIVLEIPGELNPKTVELGNVGDEVPSGSRSRSVLRAITTEKYVSTALAIKKLEDAAPALAEIVGLFIEAPDWSTLPVF